MGRNTKTNPFGALFVGLLKNKQFHVEKSWDPFLEGKI